MYPTIKVLYNTMGRCVLNLSVMFCKSINNITVLKKILLVFSLPWFLAAVTVHSDSHNGWGFLLCTRITCSFLCMYTHEVCVGVDVVKEQLIIHIYIVWKAVWVYAIDQIGHYMNVTFISRFQWICWCVYFFTKHELFGGVFCLTVNCTTESPGYFCKVAMSCFRMKQRTASIRVRFYLDTWPFAEGRYAVVLVLCICNAA